MAEMANAANKTAIVAEKPAGKPKAKDAGGKPEGGGRPGGPRKMTMMGKVGLVVGIALAVIVWFMPPLWGMEAAGQHYLAIMVLCIVWWFTTPIQPQFTALLLMALPWILGVTDIGTAFSGWTMTTTWFIFGALLLGGMVTAVGLDKRIVYWMLGHLGKLGSSFNGILLSIYLIAIVATFIIPSGSVMTALLCALFFPFINEFGVSKESNIGKAIMMFIPFIVVLNGRMYLTGSTYNMVSVGVLEGLGGQSFTYLTWMLACAPACIIMCIVLYFVFRATAKPEVDHMPGGAEMFRQKYAELGDMSIKEKKGAIIFLLALVMWATQSLHGINVNVVAVSAAILCMLPGVGVMSFRDGIKNSNWPIIIFTAAVMSLPKALGTLGIEAAFSTAFSGITASITTPLMFLVVLWLLCQIGGWLGLGIAVPSIMVPLMVPAATALGIPLSEVIIIQTLIAPMVFFYHAPQPMIASSYGTFKQTDFAKYGFFVMFAWIPVILLMYYCYWPILINAGILF